MANRKLFLLPGDGIGPEVMAEVRPIIDGPTILRMRETIREVRCAEAIARYVARFVRASDPAHADAAPSAKTLLRYGAGVRGAQSVILAAKVAAKMAGRDHVGVDRAGWMVAWVGWRRCCGTGPGP